MASHGEIGVIVSLTPRWYGPRRGARRDHWSNHICFWTERRGKLVWEGFHRLRSMILASTSEVTLATKSWCAFPTSKGVREVNQAFLQRVVEP